MHILIMLALILSACGGGQYASSDRQPGNVDRGETQGRSFEFISNLPDGEDWQVRVRDSSMWASYSEGEDSKEYKAVNLDGKETAKLWDLVDELKMPDRKKGKTDEDEGYVTLRVREPTGETDYDVFTTNVSRATDDEAVKNVAGYLMKLIMKYHKKEADF